MGCCSIFDRSLYNDIDTDALQPDINWLKRFINSYDITISGIWIPILVKSSDSKVEYGELLSQPRMDINNPFDPCNCTSDVIQNYTDLEADTSFGCSYCLPMAPTNFSKSWKLKDTNGNESTQSFLADCTSGACDTRMKKDDYLPRIPYVNQKYLNNKFYDFKYLKEFPAITNGGLGYEGFISGTASNLRSFSCSQDYRIDWVLKPTLSEIAYNPLTSEYNNQDDHERAYKKGLQTNKTCGNFILTKVNPAYSGINPYYPIFSGLIGDPDQTTVTSSYVDLLPKVSDFSAPYGFSSNTYDNIFIKTERIGSHWKWNFTKGILGWYRHFDIDKENDTRPIKGVDLYISPGDVFWATNQGPEPAPIANPTGESPEIKSCPSGLKLIKNNIVTGVIPTGSEFTYISSNLYNSFLDIYARIEKNDQLFNLTEDYPIEKFNLAAILCTAPQYDAVTIDLLKANKGAGFNQVPNVLASRPRYLSRKNYIDINSYGQNLDYNYDMTRSSIGSVNGFGFIKTKQDLIDTLVNKYGGYIWCPQDSTLSINYDQKIKDQCYVDLSFDMVIPISAVKSHNGCSSDTECSQFNGTIFSYNQRIGHKNILSTRINNGQKYTTTCSNGDISISSIAHVASLYLNGDKIKEVIFSSGCSIYQDTYPRIITSTSTRSCKYCEPESSYGLVTTTDNNVCKNGDGTPDNFCDYKLANYYNNSENPQAGLIGTRIGREILDGTLYFKRSYHAAAFDPHIDRVGFHHQNGIYFDSLAFGPQSGSTYFLQSAFETSSDGHSIAIGFDTKKAGIKLYGIKIEKLRSASADSANCLGFPNNEPCKCYGLNITPSHPYSCSNNGSITFTNNPVLFTPNLSTKYGPSIKAYGGYSEQYIDELFLDSNNRIPGHPDVGQTLDYLSEKINPEYPYGCEQSINISLPNYVKTSWSFTVSNFDTNHADIWAEVLENVDLFNPNNYTEDEYGDSYAVSNIGYQRFANRVEINNKSVFDKQKKIVSDRTNYSSSRWGFDVVLTNPYLQSLLGDAVTLYPPTGTFCSNETVYGGRGDELTIVPIKLTRIPRKQILNFGIHPIQAMGTLRAGYFDPNKGLEYTQGERQFGPLHVNHPEIRDQYYFDYDGGIFPKRGEPSKDPITGETLSDPASERFQSYVLIGDLTKQIRETLLKIQNLNVSKLRLYLQIEGRWYLYNTPNLFGYIANNKTYSGPPFIFEYAYKNDRKTTPSIITSCPKEHITFDYFRYPVLINFTGRSNPYKDLKLQYPAIADDLIEAELMDDNSVRIEGIRPYFMLQESYSPIFSNATSISLLESTVVDSINKNDPYVLLSPKKQIWKYKGIGDKRNLKSYILTSRYNPYDIKGNFFLQQVYGDFSYFDFLYENYSSLNIDLSKTNSDGYVYGSYKRLNLLDKYYLETTSAVIVENSENGFLAKYLKIEYIDKYGNKINSANTTNGYPKIYTHFVLNHPVRSRILSNRLYKLDLSPFAHKQIVLYQSLTDMLKKELDHIISNPFTRAKWSDVLNFDGSINNDITNYTYIKNNESLIYPSSLYLNNFYKLIVNPNNNYYNFYCLINNDRYFSYSDRIYYNIHQKYSIGKEYEPSNNELSLLENYLPYIDLNFVGDTDPYGLSAFGTSGTVKISGMYKYLNADHDWEHYANPITGSALFWVNLDPAFNLQSSLSFNNKIYSDTFRIDDVPYQLYDINCTTNANSDGCRQTFYPIVPNSEITSYNTFNFETDYSIRAVNTSPFVRFPIYCDSDTLDTCGSKSCGIKTVGSTACSGLYKIYEEKNIAITGNLHNVPFIISAEEGLYNPIGNNQPHFIQRFELSPENPLIVSSGASCSLYPLRPKRDSLNNNNRLSVLNEDYQAALDDSIVDDHSDLVKNTDIFANEMLFRLIYGEKQKLNLNTLNQNNQSITYAHLLKYTDPRVTAKDIYKNIPYEYDTTAPLDNRIINGSISIQGVLRVGKSVNIQIGSHSLSCSIIKDNGNIKIQATYNGETIEGIVYQEYTDNNSVAVCSGPCSSPNANTTYTLLKTCQELQQYSHSLSRVTTGATLFKQCAKPCGQGCTEEELTDISFPYWSNELQIGLGPVGDGPCVTYVIYSPCSNNQGGWHQTNHNIVSIEDAVPQGCSIIASNSAEITYSSYARGAFFGCYPKPMRTQVSADGLFNTGEVEDFNGGLMIGSPGAIGDGINISEPSCGTCFSLNYEDPLSKNKLYNVFGGGSYPPSPGSTSRSCDCADWEYGYCRNTNNASSCVCNGLQYDYTEFDYSFEYCRYNITLKGYKRRIKYPVDAKAVTITPACLSTSEGITYVPNDAGPGGAGGRASESCLWIECPGAVPTRWHIYDVKSRTQNNAYNPLCPQQLCTINYSNNKITLTLSSGQSKCWYFDSLSPNNSCPLLSVTVPDNTFTVTDSIDALCSDCINKEPKLDMLKQQQAWDIMQETRICVLGYLLTGGNPNQDGPVGMGGSVWPAGYCGIRAPLCYQREGTGGAGQCGKNAPDSYPWSVCISYSEPKVCVGGNSGSIVTGCNIPVSFPYSNARAGERIVSLWKKQMGQIWLNTAPCHNNKNKYNTEDIVEGVVPDSCSEVKYTTISYPSMAYRATFGDPVVTQGSVTFTVAYYTYTYRRPKTIQDIFKGDELVQKCSQVTAYNPAGSTLNISEYHKTSNCSSALQCYDINTENCDSSNYCCRYGKTNYE